MNNTLFSLIATQAPELNYNINKYHHEHFEKSYQYICDKIWSCSLECHDEHIVDLSMVGFADEPTNMLRCKIYRNSWEYNYSDREHLYIKTAIANYITAARTIYLRYNSIYYLNKLSYKEHANSEQYNNEMLKTMYKIICEL
jgi:hypothetical protein